MARLPYVDPANAPDRVREALEAIPPLNIFRMLAHAETAAAPYLRFGGAILSRLELDPRLRELAILQVAAQAEAEYEWVQHESIGRTIGLSDVQIAAVREGRIGDSAALSEPERAVLAFAAAVVSSPRVSDALFDELARHLGPREIVELLLTVGNYLMLARIMTTLELELDEPVGEITVKAARSPGADQ
jgi:4-carboxymuconolactone decarboxylase